MTKQGKYLALIHSIADAFNSFFFSKAFLEAADSEAFLILLLPPQCFGNLFKILRILFSNWVFPRNLLLVLALADLLSPLAQKVPGLGDAKLTRDDLVEVAADEDEDDGVEGNDRESTVEGVAIEFLTSFTKAQTRCPEVVQEQQFGDLKDSDCWEDSEGIHDSSWRWVCVERRVELKRDEEVDQCIALGSLLRRRYRHNNKSNSKHCSNCQEKEHEDQEAVNFSKHSTCNEKCLNARAVQIKNHKMNEPSKVVGSILEAHHLHAHSGLGFFLGG